MSPEDGGETISSALPGYMGRILSVSALVLKVIAWVPEGPLGSRGEGER